MSSPSMVDAEQVAELNLSVIPPKK
jgi:hypothetical protein